ncbi:hypothetical protein PSAB6_420095 [Paraburkholderia sabiae]|nr:hypothetical protein PSAB6_420095 [Paraburkholderia sabiae]
MRGTAFDGLLHPHVAPQHLLTFLAASGLLTFHQGPTSFGAQAHLESKRTTWIRIC